MINFFRFLVPLELFLPQRRDQTKFHEEWKTDAVYFAVSHLLVQYVAILVQLPTETLFRNVGLQPIQEAVQSLPFLAQLFFWVVCGGQNLCSATHFYHGKSRRRIKETKLVLLLHHIEESVLRVIPYLL